MVVMVLRGGGGDKGRGDKGCGDKGVIMGVGDERVR